MADVGGTRVLTQVEEARGIIGLRVPGTIAYRHLAIRLITTACKMALEVGPPGDDEGFEAEVVSAFGEAFNNIAIHGETGRDAGAVQIEVGWDEEKLTITSIDEGRVFDPESVAQIDLDQLHEHGMGLFIMKSCMDRIEYQPGPPNVLRMVKLRARKSGEVPTPAASGGRQEPSSTPPAPRAAAPRAASSPVTSPPTRPAPSNPPVRLATTVVHALASPAARMELPPAACGVHLPPLGRTTLRG
jgi:serine/threonine-protein kinase RsbW